MDPQVDVWLAKGPCSSCGKPVAARGTGPGMLPARCNACHVVTTLPALPHRRTPAGLEAMPLPQPTAPPPAPPAPAATMSHAPRGRATWIALAVVAVLVLAGGGYAAYLVLGAGDEVPAAVRQTMTIDFGDDTATFRVVYEAFDEESKEIPLSRAKGLEPWAFAVASTDAPPTGLTWTSCEVDRCTYEAPAGAFVVYAAGGPSENFVYGIDTATQEVSFYTRLSGWEPSGAWPGSEVVTSVLVAPVPAGQLSTVQVRLNGTEDAEVRVAFLEDGAEVRNQTLRYDAFFGRAGFPGFFSGHGKPFELVVTSSEGVELGRRSYPKPECDGSFDIELVLDATGALVLPEGGCGAFTR